MKSNVEGKIRDSNGYEKEQKKYILQKYFHVTYSNPMKMKNFKLVNKF